MNDLQTALETTLEVLEAAEIDHAISGSLAAAHHGYVRATEDIDIQVAIDDLSQLDAAADRLPPEVRRIDVETWRFPGAIDVELYRVRDELDEACMASRVEGHLPDGGSRRSWFVPLEALLVLKIREHVRHGHGHKHLADIEQLLARNHDRLDVEELEDLLALDPAWEQAWDELVETRP